MTESQKSQEPLESLQASESLENHSENLNLQSDMIHSIVLISKEQNRFEIEASLVRESKLLATMLEFEEINLFDRLNSSSSTSSTADSSKIELELSSISGKNLAKVCQYLTHHKDNPSQKVAKPITTNDMTKIATEWDAKFCDHNIQELREMTLTANYLDLQSMLDLLLCKFATLISGKNSRELKEIFQVQVQDQNQDQDK